MILWSWGVYREIAWQGGAKAPDNTECYMTSLVTRCWSALYVVILMIIFIWHSHYHGPSYDQAVFISVCSSRASCIFIHSFPVFHPVSLCLSSSHLFTIFISYVLQENGIFVHAYHSEPLTLPTCLAVCSYPASSTVVVKTSSNLVSLQLYKKFHPTFVSQINYICR